VSLWTLDRHKPVIPVVTFLTPLPWQSQVCKGSWGPAFAVVSLTEGFVQAGIWPYPLRWVSVPPEPTFGRLRYNLTGVPPQPNSPSGLFPVMHRGIPGPQCPSPPFPPAGRVPGRIVGPGWAWSLDGQGSCSPFATPGPRARRSRGSSGEKQWDRGCCRL